jgi:hypothetical protein
VQPHRCTNAELVQILTCWHSVVDDLCMYVMVVRLWLSYYRC